MMRDPVSKGGGKFFLRGLGDRNWMVPEKGKFLRRIIPERETS